jgi:hypothetical protein
MTPPNGMLALKKKSITLISVLRGDLLFETELLWGLENNEKLPLTKFNGPRARRDTSKVHC